MCICYWVQFLFRILNCLFWCETDVVSEKQVSSEEEFCLNYENGFYSNMFTLKKWKKYDCAVYYLFFWFCFYLFVIEMISRNSIDLILMLNNYQMQH